MNTEENAVTTPALTIAQRMGHAAITTTTGMVAINVEDPNISAVAQAICQNMPCTFIYRRGENYLTVRQSIHQKNGLYFIQEREMTSRRLCSYLGDHLIFRKGAGDKAKRVSLSKELAEKVLASDVFFDHTPELEMVVPVRLPVWEQSEGARRIIIPAAGFDPVTGNYIAETLNYTAAAPRLTPAQLVAFWNNLMASFPWGSESKKEEDQVWRHRSGSVMGPCPSTNRSACCCLALMLGQYCRLLIDDVMPMGIFNANQPGSGKTLLAMLCISPVWGMGAATATPKNEEEMIKGIHTALLAKKGYFLMDDIPVLNNNTINMVATANEIEGRVLGGLSGFSTKNRMQIFATGNGIGTSPDVERRALIIDLFLSGNALERKFTTTLDQKTINAPSMRADMLRFMHAMVQNWNTAGCPILVDKNAKPSFSSFATIVGSIMLHNGFASPFTPRKYSGAGGDLIGRTVKKLLAKFVTIKLATTRTGNFKIAEIVEFADAHDLTQTITGGKSPSHSMGKRLEPLRGQILQDENARPFEFGKREEAGHSSYTFTRLD